jgi:protein arginine kinase activator
MTCSKCKQNKALVQITIDNEGETKSYFICKKCAKLIGFVSPLESPKFPLDKILEDIQSLPAGNPDEGDKPVLEVEMKPGLKCDNCGLTFDEFMRIGRCGCSVCYEAFKPNLDAIIESIHGTTQHVGRAPKSQEPVMEPYFQKNRLEAELREAIATEDYEKAADIRDRMKDLA